MFLKLEGGYYVSSHFLIERIRPRQWWLCPITEQGTTRPAILRSRTLREAIQFAQQQVNGNG